jgi:hypothetical protein
MSINGAVNIGKFTILELAQIVVDLVGSRSKIVHRPLPENGDGLQTHSCCYVDDLVDGLVSFMVERCCIAHKTTASMTGCPDFLNRWLEKRPYDLRPTRLHHDTPAHAVLKTDARLHLCARRGRRLRTRTRVCSSRVPGICLRRSITTGLAIVAVSRSRSRARNCSHSIDDPEWISVFFQQRNLRGPGPHLHSYARRLSW